MAKTLALVMSSGGLRSVVTMAIAAREHRIAAVHMADLRSTEQAAGAAFDRQVECFKPVKSWKIDGAYLQQMALPIESATIAPGAGADGQADLVPYRELQLLSVAAGLARQARAGIIYWGVQIDPKNTDALARAVEIVQLFSQLLEVLAPDQPMSVQTPLLGLQDQQLIELGHQVHAPFAASWTCHTQTQKPCQSCPACTRRMRAFRAARLDDPLLEATREQS